MFRAEGVEGIEPPSPKDLFYRQAQPTSSCLTPVALAGIEPAYPAF